MVWVEGTEQEGSISNGVRCPECSVMIHGIKQATYELGRRRCRTWQ